MRVVLDPEHRPVATGSVLFTMDGTARIGRVLVDPERRGEGSGRALVEALVAEAETQEHVAVIRLGVYGLNAVARALYESLGFEATPEPGRPVTVDGAHWVSIEMERPVSR